MRPPAQCHGERPRGSLTEQTQADAHRPGRDSPPQPAPRGEAMRPVGPPAPCQVKAGAPSVHKGDEFSSLTGTTKAGD